MELRKNPPALGEGWASYYGLFYEMNDGAMLVWRGKARSLQLYEYMFLWPVDADSAWNAATTMACGMPQTKGQPGNVIRCSLHLGLPGTRMGCSGPREASQRHRPCRAR